MEDAVVAADHEAILHIVAEQGVDTRVRYQQSGLLVACKVGMADTAQLLLGLGADVDATDSVQRTSLHIAAQRGHMDCVRMLLQYGASTHSVDAQGQTPLLKAVGWQQVAVVLALLLCGDAQKDACNAYGVNALLLEDDFVDHALLVEQQSLERWWDPFRDQLHGLPIHWSPQRHWMMDKEIDMRVEMALMLCEASDECDERVQLRLASFCAWT